MSFKDKLRDYVNSKKQQFQRGIEVSNQMKAEKLRKKYEKMGSYEPGTFRYGLGHKQKTLDFMRDAYERRKKRREDKNESS